MMKKVLVLLCVLCPGGAAAAQDQAGSGGDREREAAPRSPEIPEPLESGEPIEPQVTIIRKDDAVIEEYRINGMLYMVRINPAGGEPYYLVDRDGDGSMESRASGLQDPPIPQWILFSW